MQVENAGKTPKSRIQKMAEYAWTTTSEGLASENFVQLAKGAPALVMANGLMQSLAYWQARGKEGGQALVQIIAGWLLGDKKGDQGFKNLMESLYQKGSSEFATATRDAIELLRWVKQFASALEKKES